MVEEEALGNGPEDEVEKKNQERDGERGRERERERECVCQEDQNMTRLLYFTRTQKGRREGVFMCKLND